MKPVVRLERRFYAKKFAGLYQMPDDEARKKKFAGKMSLYYFKEMGLKTAADYLLESSKPALIMQGGKDFQVLAEDDRAAFVGLIFLCYVRSFPGPLVSVTNKKLLGKIDRSFPDRIRI